MKYISASSTCVAAEGFMPVVMATGDVALFRKRPQPEHFRFSPRHGNALSFVFAQFGAQDRCAVWWNCSTADWRAIECHETNIPQASRLRL
ncbi:hypothetical protein GFM13_03800 [Rhizobium leguminosarum bv. viciae]|nr:hypothetical protein [Rhizobium leguminosarum bv. viciae]